MTSVRIRFILTGSCHPYSGRQVFFIVPLESSATRNPTTIGEVKNQYVRQRWPKELASVFEGRDVALKILKNGRLLADEVNLRDAFSSEEIDQCSAKRGDADQPVSESSALMHLVFSVPFVKHEAEEPARVKQEPPIAKKQAAADSGCGCSML